MREIARRRSRVVDAFKNAVRAAHDEDMCEGCGWTPPLRSAKTGRPLPGLLHAHHVVPIAEGGHDKANNLVLLCPNCHAVAHALIRRSIDASATGLDPNGFPTPPTLLAILRRLSKEPVTVTKVRPRRVDS